MPLSIKRKTKKGFSLVECLIGMTIFGFISLAGLEFFDLARRGFVQLQAAEQAAADVFAAADLLTRDVHSAGAGLQAPCALRLLRPLETEGDSLVCRLFVEELVFQGDLRAGQTEIPLLKPGTAARGGEICLFDAGKGETARLAEITKFRLKLSSPLRNPYRGEEAALILLKKIAFYHDGKKHVLRRRVNESPAQPLCEQTEAFSFSWDEKEQMLSFAISVGGDHGFVYKTTICPKNCRLLPR
jgi:prepilin-type N-terminal cleavage/methylation domain-containing protein